MTTTWHAPSMEELSPAAMRCFERIRPVLPPSNPANPADPSVALSTLMAILHGALSQTELEKRADAEAKRRDAAWFSFRDAQEIVSLVMSHVRYDHTLVATDELCERIVEKVTSKAANSQEEGRPCACTGERHEIGCFLRRFETAITAETAPPPRDPGIRTHGGWLPWWRKRRPKKPVSFAASAAVESWLDLLVREQRDGAAHSQERPPA